MNKNFLATTALEEFWDKKATNGLFLGEWCKLYNRKEEYGKLRFHTLEYNWKKKENIDNGINFCDDMYKEVLIELIDILNRYNNVNKGYKYWDILLRPWLLIYIQVLYDRYTHLKKANDTYKNIYTYTIDETNYQFVTTPNIYKNLIMNDDWYNLQIYSQIVKFLDMKFINKPFEKKLQADDINYNSSIKEKLLRKITTIVNQIFHTKTVLISAPYFKEDTISKTIYLWFKSRFVFVFDNFRYDISVKKKIDIQTRKKLFKEKTQEKSFKNLVFNTFIYNFPTIYLENYLEFSQKVEELKIVVPHVSCTSQLIHGNEIFKFFIANNYNNLKKCYGQHGGGYGIDFINVPEEIEKNYADIFYSYGWKDKNVKPLAMSYNQIKKFKDNGKVNLVLNNMARYFCRFTYQPESTKGLDNIKNVESFLKELNIVKHFVIRLYPSDFNISVKKRLLEIKDNLVFDNKTNYYKQIKESRLNVFSHLSTGYLETLAINKPTMIIAPKDSYYFRERAKPYIQLLKDANILFENPLEAAEFVEKIYDNVTDWWQSDNVQKAREEFCYQYARTSKNWASDWVKEFNSILEDNARN